MFRLRFAVCAALCAAAWAPSAFAQGRAIRPEVDRCIIAAADHYYSPRFSVSYAGFVDLIRALYLSEAGCGKRIKNSDGSTDYGCMQINSIHLPELKRYGISAEILVHNDCQNIAVGTWILSTALAQKKNLWFNIGSYNSSTPDLNRIYQMRVWRNLQKLWELRLHRNRYDNG